MTAPLRILHVADSHIGADLPRRATTRRPRRGCDFVASYRRVLARAREHAVDLVLHAGDLFDTPLPSDGALAAATQPLWDLATAGIPVVVVPGNHERSALPHVLLLTHPNIHVLRTPRTVAVNCRGTRVALSGFPCLPRAAAARFGEVLAATGWADVPADVRILVTHQAFEGARCGPANYRFRVTDDGEVVPRDAVPTAFDYVAAGHVHRHQVLNGDGRTPIVYSGSPDRIALAEIGEPKGCVLVEFDGGQARPRFLEHPVRPMAVVPIDVTGDARPRLLLRVLEQISQIERDAFVHVRLSGTTTPETLRNLRLTQEILRVRPDLLVAVSSQAIEWRRPERVVTQRRPATNAFAVLHPPAKNVAAVDTADVRALPDRCGTYACYDGAGRLAYVGKALRVRTRIRSHLRGDGRGGHFADWATRVRRVEVRAAQSELEALLVEAELIRVHRPPFNRQMRLWSRYGYLCAAENTPHGQLELRRDPVAGRLCFGPLRSKGLATAAADALSAAFGLAQCPVEAGEGGNGRLPLVGGAQLCARYYAGQCTGPCAGRVTPAEYADRLRARDAFLEGDAHPRVAALLEEIAALQRKAAGGEADGPGSDRTVRHAEDDDAEMALDRHGRRAKAGEQAGGEEAGVLAEPHIGGRTPREAMLRTLERLHQTAGLLREARALLNALLFLPGSEDRQMAAVITPRGLYLRRFVPGAGEEERLAAWHRARVRPLPPISGNWLPKSITDVLCTAWRHTQRNPQLAEPRLSAGQR